MLRNTVVLLGSLLLEGPIVVWHSSRVRTEFLFPLYTALYFNPAVLKPYFSTLVLEHFLCILLSLVKMLCVRIGFYLITILALVHFPGLQTYLLHM